jgi:SAM-dependent methyltransferase
MEIPSCPEILDRPCPSCLGQGGEQLFRQRFAIIPGVSLHDGYPVTACGTCGAVYASRLPAQTHFDAYYADLSKYQNADDLMDEGDADRRRYEAIALELAHRLPWRDRTILDVGCAAGGLMEALEAQGFTQVMGVDPSAACVDTARRRGLRAEQGLLVDPLPGGPHGAVLAIGVLEHVRDLDPALTNLRQALDRDGMLYVEVPDLMRPDMGHEAPFQEFSTEHITFFTERSLDRLMARHGLCPAFGGERLLNRGYRISELHVPSPPVDEDGPRAAKRYLESCVNQVELEARAMEALARGRELIAVWGAGTLACRLMATTALAQAPVAAFVDRNPHLYGRELAGIPIHPPDWLRSFSGPVLIASWGHGEAIQTSLRRDFGLKNAVIRLDG